MYKAWAVKHGFTIIELLVVMAVIGILATIMIVSYSGIQQRSRDSQRDSDVTQIKMALEKYHADKSEYPGVCSGDNMGCSVSALATDLSPYLSVIPHDPKYDADSGNDYQYVRSAPVNDAYAIEVQYEAKSPCKTGQNVSAGWWGAALPTC